MYEDFEISKELGKIAIKAEKEIDEILKKIDEDAMYNSKKVLMAFQKNEVSEMHFGTSTGYGEGDVRKKLYRKNICRSIMSEKIVLLEISLYQEHMH